MVRAMDKHTDHDDVEPMDDSITTDTGTGAHAVHPGHAADQTATSTGTATSTSTSTSTSTEHLASHGTTGKHADTTADGNGTDHGHRASIADLDEPGHVFDQTNGLAGDVDGESDGTADSDLSSAAERGDDTGVNPGTDAGTGRIAFNPDDRV